MRILKIILSVLALLVSAAAGVLASGSPVQVNPRTISLIATIATGIAFLGISPWQVTDVLAKGFSAASLMTAGVVAWHAGNVTAAENPHPFVWAAIAFAGAVIGVMGKSPIHHVPPTAADGPLIQPKPPTV